MNDVSNKVKHREYSREYSDKKSMFIESYNSFRNTLIKSCRNTLYSILLRKEFINCLTEELENVEKTPVLEPSRLCEQRAMSVELSESESAEEAAVNK